MSILYAAAIWAWIRLRAIVRVFVNAVRVVHCAGKTSIEVVPLCTIKYALEPIKERQIPDAGDALFVWFSYWFSEGLFGEDALGWPCAQKHVPLDRFEKDTFLSFADLHT